jgi:hypothetical protein
MKATKFATAMLLSALLVAPSYAAAPLPAGKPVGSTSAAILSGIALPLAAIGGFAALAAILATTAGKGGNDGVTPPTTSTGTP